MGVLCLPGEDGLWVYGLVVVFSDVWYCQGYYLDDWMLFCIFVLCVFWVVALRGCHLGFVAFLFRVWILCLCLFRLPPSLWGASNRRSPGVLVGSGTGVLGSLHGLFRVLCSVPCMFGEWDLSRLPCLGRIVRG